MFNGRARKRVRVRGLVSVIVKVMFRDKVKVSVGAIFSFGLGYWLGFGLRLKLGFVIHLSLGLCVGLWLG
jgi:hypothetical protein